MMRVILLLISCFAAFPTLAENWGQWRGPLFNGSTSEKGLPAEWSKEQNIAWSLDMAGPSASTPVVWGDRVYVSSSDSAAKSLLAICVDRRAGKVLWQAKVADGYARDEKSNYSSPSPATDGTRVIFFYGSGDLAAFECATGNKLWSRNLQKEYGDFAFQWTFSTSPLLYNGKVYMQVLQRDVPVGGRGSKDKANESYLLALNPATGEELWRVIRPSEAVAESREAFSTPVAFEHNGRKEILIAGGDCLSGADPETGKELWRWGTWNPTKIGHWRLVPSPVAGGGVVLACAPKGDPIYAVKAGLSGNLDDSALAWKSEKQSKVSSDVPTPAFYDGDFFVLSDNRKALSRVEPKTGKVKWSVETPGRAKYESSPSVADGKIYFINFAGEVTVVDAAKGEVLKTIPMGDEGENMIRSSVAISQGQLFIRTNKRLYCVGKKEAVASLR
jgi:outer membrane protein assembly factor BamB